MSLFGNNTFLILQQKINEINAAIQNADIATGSANQATENTIEKLNELDNFNFPRVDIGNYRFDHNQLDDTLELEYIGD